MNSDDMRRGIIPGVIAGYVFLAYAGPDITVSFTLHVSGALYGVFMLYVKLGWWIL